MEMKNNVYGLIGIGVKNAMWNAGFDKYPKTSGNGVIKGSPYALQYCYKSQWDKQGKKIMGLKTIDSEGKILNVIQKYETVTEDLNGNNYNNVLNNLLECEDVKNFGIVFTGKAKSKGKGKAKKEGEEDKINVGIRGIIQIADGINKFDDTECIVENVLSPYKNLNKDNATMTSSGERVTVDEAHYIYDFNLFAKQYDDYKNNGFKGYTREDYEVFKETSLNCVSNYNSKAKMGCKNEFALFIETKENMNYLLNLGCLEELVKVYKEENKVIYDVTELKILLEQLTDKIESIELYYNPRTLDIKGWSNFESGKIYDIITMGEI